jgi:acyl carrier protein
MKSHEEITQEVKQLVATRLHIPPEDLEGSNQISDLTTDSIQLFELLLAFEEYYQLQAAYEDVIDLHTIDDIIRYVSRVKYQLDN